MILGTSFKNTSARQKGLGRGEPTLNFEKNVQPKGQYLRALRAVCALVSPPRSFGEGLGVGLNSDYLCGEKSNDSLGRDFLCLRCFRCAS